MATMQDSDIPAKGRKMWIANPVLRGVGQLMILIILAMAMIHIVNVLPRETLGDVLMGFAILNLFAWYFGVSIWKMAIIIVIIVLAFLLYTALEPTLIYLGLH